VGGAGLARSAAARDRIRRVHLDFLGLWPFGCENPRFRVLDFLGFPWILSSESIHINGLRWIFAEKFFLGVFPLGGFTLRRGSPILVVRKGKLVHGASLPYFLLFWNQLSSSRLLSAYRG
jgi:hypothetical protein